MNDDSYEALGDGTVLFHYTSRAAITQIVGKGLLAQPFRDYPASVLGRIKAVWLTSDPFLPPVFSHEAEYRCTVVLPHSTAKLVHLETRLRDRMTRKQLAAIHSESRGHGRSFYLHLGNVAFRRIKEIRRYLDRPTIESYQAAYLADPTKIPFFHKSWTLAA